jgi:carbonic anhydrase
MKSRCMCLGLACFFQSFVLLCAQEQSSLTPDQAWQRLKDGNERFVSGQMESKDLGAKKRQELAKGQRPFAIVLSCADSRVPPEYIFNQGLGDLFVLRVAGNISDPLLVASMEYAVEHFQVPLIIVLGHEDCGAVKAALGKDRPGGDLGKLIDAIHVGKDLPLEKTAAEAEAIKNNVRHQIDAITKHSAVIKNHVDQKKLVIVSGVYSLSSGKVEWLKGKQLPGDGKR